MRKADIGLQNNCIFANIGKIERVSIGKLFAVFSQADQ